jgi:catechol 2,3-dioxygenase-like lactoylglutathione lyase family enzyme
MMPSMPNSSVLGSQEIVAFLVTTSCERARAFYGDVLGLKLVSEDSFALVFDANGTMLRISPAAHMQPAKHTVLGWRVANIEHTLEALRERGVIFEHYGMPNQNESGIWTAPGGARIAWFKDPDGNTLSLTQFA